MKSKIGSLLNEILPNKHNDSHITLRPTPISIKEERPDQAIPEIHIIETSRITENWPELENFSKSKETFKEHQKDENSGSLEEKSTQRVGKSNVNILSQKENRFKIQESADNNGLTFEKGLLKCSESGEINQTSKNENVKTEKKFPLVSKGHKENKSIGDLSYINLNERNDETDHKSGESRVSEISKKGSGLRIFNLSEHQAECEKQRELIRQIEERAAKLKKKEKKQRNLLQKMKDKNDVLSHWKNNLSSLFDRENAPKNNMGAEVEDLSLIEREGQRRRGSIYQKKFKTLNGDISFKSILNDCSEGSEHEVEQAKESELKTEIKNLKEEIFQSSKELEEEKRTRENYEKQNEEKVKELQLELDEKNRNLSIFEQNIRTSIKELQVLLEEKSREITWLENENERIKAEKQRLLTEYTNVQFVNNQLREELKLKEILNLDKCSRIENSYEAKIAELQKELYFYTHKSRTQQFIQSQLAKNFKNVSQQPSDGSRTPEYPGSPVTIKKSEFVGENKIKESDLLQCERKKMKVKFSNSLQMAIDEADTEKSFEEIQKKSLNFDSSLQTEKINENKKSRRVHEYENNRESEQLSIGESHSSFALNCQTGDEKEKRKGKLKCDEA